MLSTRSAAAARRLPSDLLPLLSTSAHPALSRSSWTAAASLARAATAHRSTSPIALDPFRLVGGELRSLLSNIQVLLGSGHPSLDTVAKYYFQAEGKHLRPLIVLLMSQATAGLSPLWGKAGEGAEEWAGVDEPLAPEGILNDSNPSLAGRSTPSVPDPESRVLPTQRRLAEITEMIHVASLLHDDVIDESPTRRSAPSAPAAFGNKLSILAGDFLLGRASVFLARLGSTEVVELLATVIANLVEGEVAQLRATSNPDTTPTKEGFERYLSKTYLKTASLMAKSARAAAILGGCGKRQGWVEGEQIMDAAYGYGRNLGIAFQLVDDLLDFSSTPSTLGKPASGADLQLGLATAPALYAWEEHHELGPLIGRRFSQPGDVELAKDLVARSSGMQRTAELAAQHADRARQALQVLPESDARVALEGLCSKVLDRVR